MRILDWNIDVERRTPQRRCSGPRSATPRASRASAREIIEAVRRGGDAALSDLTRSASTASDSTDLAVSPRGVRRRRARARRARQHRGARHRDRDGAQVSRGAVARAAPGRDRAGRAVRAHQRAGTRGRPVRTGGFGAAALDRHHAGGSGRDRRLSRSASCAPPRTGDGSADPRSWSPRARRAIEQDLQGGRRAGHRRHGLRHGVHTEMRQAVRSGQRLGDGGEIAGGGRSRRRRGRFAGRRHRGDGDRRSSMRAPISSPPTCSPRRSTAPTRRRYWSPPRRRSPGRSRARSRGKCRSLSRQRSSATSVREMRLLVVDSLERAFGVANDYAPEHLLLRDSRAAPLACRACKRRARCSSAAGRPESDGRLLQRPESHLADLRLRQGLQRPVAGGFPKAHHGAGAHAGGASAAWARRPEILARLEGLDAHAAAVGDPPRRARGAPSHEPGARAGAARDTRTLKPYSHAAWLPSMTRLHANEAPWRPRGRCHGRGTQSLSRAAARAR